MDSKFGVSNIIHIPGTKDKLYKNKAILWKLQSQYINFNIPVIISLLVTPQHSQIVYTLYIIFLTPAFIT